MPIPAFREDGWLPEGHWQASWEEIEDMFGGIVGSRRRTLFDRLLLWRNEMRDRSLSGRLLLDGSFISSKEVPGDIDAFFVFDDRSESIIYSDPIAMELINYNRIKDRGIGDVLCYTATSVRNHPKFCRIDGFDLDKRTLLPKGLVEVTI